jgi:fluoride exporter
MTTTGGAYSPLSLALVALGGAVGSVLRYAVSVQGVLWFGLHFPWGTLAVNVVGSAAIGALGALPLPQEARLLLITGLLGGFTTFSAFSLETELLWHRAPLMALLYVGSSLTLGLAACALCFWIARGVQSG